ncbi:hypothetical protein ACFLZN_01010 [Nanoarchaeota archaeon]
MKKEVCVILISLILILAGCSFEKSADTTPSADEDYRSTNGAAEDKPIPPAFPTKENFKENGVENDVSPPAFPGR